MGKDEFSDFRNPDDASLERLLAAVERAYHRPWHMMWRSFLHGIMTAIGAAVGWILIIILTGVVFQALGGIALFKPALDKLQDTITEAQQRATRQQQQELIDQLQKNNTNQE